MACDLYIFGPNEILLSIIKNDIICEAKHHEKLNGDNNFSFTIPADQVSASYVASGNLVGFRDLDSYWQFFEIKKIGDKHGDDLTRTAYCEHIFYELLDDIVTDKRPSAGASAALSGMLEGTRWQIGIVDDLGTASCQAYYENALSAVQKVATAWKGELQWRCTVTDNVITRYVDLLASRGTDTGKQFIYSKDIENIEREEDISGIYTAMYGQGKGIETESGEEKGRRLSFSDVVWTTPTDPANKPVGQEWVGDSTALARWGRPGGRHRFGIYTNDKQEDATKLLEETWADLQNKKEPCVSYKLTVGTLEVLTGYGHEGVRLGDLTRVIDRAFNPELLESARVIVLTRDLINPKDTEIELGNFAPTIIEVTINTQKQVSEIGNKPYNTAWLDGRINVLQNEIENSAAFHWETPQGTLYMNAATYTEATEAMLIGGGIFALANQKDGQGGWDWRTFGTGEGFTLEEMTAGKIRAEQVQIGQASTFATGYDPSTKVTETEAEAVAATVVSTYNTNTVQPAINSLQSQIDGQIMTWFYDYIPTSANAPASNWTTDPLKIAHLGDLFYDTSTGYCYRWAYSASVYQWLRVVDEGIAAALELAQHAEDTADHKRRVFVVTPTDADAYDVGDLWAAGSATDLRKCKTAKIAGAAYSITHWEYASKFIPSAGLGVDSYCNVLAHFDDSLLTHKGDGLSFTRTSVATKQDGSQVASGLPRYETGKFGKAIMVEDGVTNLITDQTIWVTYTGASLVRTLETTGQWAGWYKVVMTTLGTNGFAGRVQTYLFPNGTTRTWSIDFYNATPNGIAPELNGAGGYGYLTYQGNNKWSITVTNSTGGTLDDGIYFRKGSTSGANTETFYYRYYQVEDKPYNTSFINGTRDAELLNIPSSKINISSGTISFWTYINNTSKRKLSSDWPMFFTWNKSSGISTRVGHNNSTSEWYVWSESGCGGYCADSLTPNGWHMFTVTYSSTYLKLYIDGVEAVSISNPSLPSTCTGIDVGYVSGQAGTYVNTLFDELRIDSVARTAEEIKSWFVAQAPFYSSEQMSAASALLVDITSDNKLTPDEKQAIKKEWDIIVSEKSTNDTQADLFGITTEKTTYGTEYTDLSNYITPLLTSLTTTSDIVGTDFRAAFKAYYDAKTALLNAISTKAKILADTAQVSANYAGRMGVDANCAILAHFDDSLLTHKGAVLTFNRDSVATKIDGTQVAIDVVRYETGKFGKGVMVEEGTQNLCLYDCEGAKPNYLVSDGSCSITVSSEQAFVGSKSIKWAWTSGTANIYLHNTSSYTQTAGTAFTVSFKVKRSDGGVVSGLSAYLYVSNNTNVNGTCTITPLSNGWYNVSYTRIGLASGAVGLTGLFGFNTSYSYYIDCWQVEAKSYATSYIFGTRQLESLSFPSSGNININQGTFSCWVKPLRSPGTNIQMILDIGDTGNSGFTSSIGQDGRFCFQVGTGTSTKIIYSTTVATINTWYNLAITWSSDQILLYVNGTLEATGTGVSGLVALTTSYIGSNRGSLRFFDGLIDEARIDTSVHSVDEIKAWYNAQSPFYAAESLDNYVNVVVTPAINNAMTAAVNAQETADGQIQCFIHPTQPSSGMAFGDIWIDSDGHTPPNTNDIYRYEDSSGGSQGTLGWVSKPTNAIGKAFLDAYLANLTNANIQNGMSGMIKSYYQDNAPVEYTKLLIHAWDNALSDVCGNEVLKFGGIGRVTNMTKFPKGCIWADGGGDYLSIADPNTAKFWQLASNNFTLEMWYKRYDSISAEYSLLSTISGSYNGFQVRIAASGITFTNYNGGTGVNASVAFTADLEWHHVAVVRNNGYVTVYHDGIGGTPVSIPTTGASTQDLKVGIDWDVASYCMRGWLADIRISNGIARYTANFTPSTTALTMDLNNGDYWTDTNDNNRLYRWNSTSKIWVDSRDTFTAGLGVDSNCALLAHFDDSLLTHKGTALGLTRASIATKLDGSQVVSGSPRYENGKFGKGIMVEEGTTNLVTNPFIEGTYSSGLAPNWLKYGSPTVSENTTLTYIKNGSKSQHIVATSAGQGIYQNISYTASTAYHRQCWVYIVSGRVELVNNGADHNGFSNSYISPSGTTGWYLLQHQTLTTDSTPSGVYIYSYGGAAEFYVDSVQVEQKTYPTSFINGTRQPESLSFPTAGLSPTAGTLSVWVNINNILKTLNASANSSKRIFQIPGSTYGNGIIMVHDANVAKFRLITFTDASNYTAIEPASSEIPNGWRMITATWDSTLLCLYCDGKLLGSVANPKLPVGLASIGYLGSYDGTMTYPYSFADTLFDEFRMDSVVHSADEIKAWYISQAPFYAAEDTSLALQGTLKYRTTGAPTNVPTAGDMHLTANTDSTINVQLEWATYTQGVNQADNIMIFWKQGIASGLGAPTINDSSVTCNVNTANSFYRFESIASDLYYSFGIAAARRTENGWEIGTIQSPTGWQDITHGTPDYLGKVAGTLASEMVNYSMGVDDRCIGLYHFGASLNSHKGIPLTFLRTGVAYSLSGVQIADGLPRFENGKFDRGILVESYTYNMLSLNQSNVETDTTGFTACNAQSSISRNTSEYYVGSASLRVYCLGTNATAVEGFKLTGISGTSGKSYCGSAYIKGTAGKQINIQMIDSTNGYASSARYITLTGSWQRVESYKLTLVANSSNMYLQITGRYYGTAQGTFTFYADCLQIEEGTGVTTWIPGSTTRNSETASLQTGVGDVTIHQWINCNDALKRSGVTGDYPTVLWYGSPSSTSTDYVTMSIGSDSIGMDCRSPSGQIYGGAKSMSLTGWHQIVLTVGSGGTLLYIDGTLELSATSITGYSTDYLYIGSSNPTYNATKGRSNTVHDELMIINYAASADQIRSWYNAQSPFYAAQDLLNLPGYVKVETDGFKVYDASNNLKAVLGSWLESTIRKYGLKIIGGRIYGSDIFTGLEGDTTYGYLGSDGSFKLVKNNNIILEMKSILNEGNLYFSKSDGTPIGRIVYYTDAYGPGICMEGYSASAYAGLSLRGSFIYIRSSSTTYVVGDLSVSGTKSAVQTTENYGMRQLYALESPESLFEDSGRTKLINGEVTILIDPIFLECIEPDTEETPWLIWCQCYGENDVYISEISETFFKIRERNQGNSNNVVIWSLRGTRRGYAGVRLMEEVHDHAND